MPGPSDWLTIRRLAGIAALGYVVGVSIENMEILQAATRDSGVDEIRATYADQALSTVALIAGALALVAYVAFVAALYMLLRERGRPGERWPLAVLVGGVGGPMVAAAGLAASAILVFDIDATAGEDVDSLYDFYLGARLISGAFVLLFMLGAGLSSLRSGALPRVLAIAALAIAAPMALGPLAAITGGHGLELAVSIAFASQTLWIFLAGLWLLLADGLPPLALVRRAAFLLLAIAAGLIGIALLAVPAATGTFFAWGLGPEPLAAFAGGVYVGAAAAYAVALPASARRARGLVAGAVVLSVSVLTVSLTHTDQFDFDRLQAWVWMALFAGFSVITIGLLLLEPAGEGEPPARLPGWARAAFGAVAAGGGALALALWIDPTGLADPWPYPLPALGGRFAGSWVALLAVVCGWAAVRDRADEARLSALLLTALPAGALIAALRTVDQLEPAGAAIAYVAALALLAALGLVVLLAATRAGSAPAARAGAS